MNCRSRIENERRRKTEKGEEEERTISNKNKKMPAMLQYVTMRALRGVSSVGYTTCTNVRTAIAIVNCSLIDSSIHPFIYFDFAIRVGSRTSATEQKIGEVRRGEREKTHPSSPIIPNLLKRSLGRAVRAFLNTPLERPSDIEDRADCLDSVNEVRRKCENQLFFFPTRVTRIAGKQRRKEKEEKRTNP